MQAAGGVFDPGKGTDVLNRSKYEALPEPWTTRMLSRYEVAEDTGCWLWTGRVDPRNGYPTAGTRRDGKTVHILPWVASYVKANGLPEPGLEIDHSCHDPALCSPPCRHRRCINPDHLIAMTRWENNARSSSPSALKGNQEACTNCGAGFASSPRQRYCPDCRKRKNALARQPGGWNYENRARISHLNVLRHRDRMATEPGYREKVNAANRASYRRRRDDLYLELAATSRIDRALDELLREQETTP